MKSQLLPRSSPPGTSIPAGTNTPFTERETGERIFLTGERFFQLDHPTSAADDEELKMKLRPRYHGH
jgi:hypothetical protein